MNPVPYPFAVILSTLLFMYTLTELPFNNTFSQLPNELFSKVKPQGLDNPVLISSNPLAAELIELCPEQLHSQAFISAFSGNSLLPGSDPLAMVYSGHQFGSYNPQLGDGRGLLLGEVTTQNHGKWDLHLKGAGQTPYSRFADGRAVLRSSIREYLCSEAMAGLGIATTRALCVIGSDTPVYRETTETGAMLLRLARSHIRFGHFEYFHYNNRPDLVKLLADYVIEQHFPELENHNDKYHEFFKGVVARNAELIARWQTVGFAHGVMNTDNMSILGDTFDYGPYGFLDDYNPGFICNHSDHTGRYAFNRQPSIGLWNLNALAHGLSTLLEPEQLKETLSTYEPILVERFDALFRAKLGLEQKHEDDQQLMSELLELLQREQSDYSLFFRQLCYFESATANTLQDRFIDRSAFNHWAHKYQQRLKWENSETKTRQTAMRSVNPKFILRNYLAQQAIDKATHEQDYSEIDRLLKILQSPYDEHSAFDHYAKEPPDWGKKLEVSCSS